MTDPNREALRVLAERVENALCWRLNPDDNGEHHNVSADVLQACRELADAVLALLTPRPEPAGVECDRCARRAELDGLLGDVLTHSEAASTGSDTK